MLTIKQNALLLLHSFLKALLKTSSLKEVRVDEVNLGLITAGLTLGDITFQSVWQLHHVDST